MNHTTQTLIWLWVRLTPSWSLGERSTGQSQSVFPFSWSQSLVLDKHMTQLRLPWTRPGVFYCREDISLYCWEDVRPIAAAAISQPQGESLSKKPMWRKEHSLVKGNRATKQLFETTSCHIWRHILHIDFPVMWAMNSLSLFEWGILTTAQKI